MHPRVIGERKEAAQRRIQVAAQSLSTSLDIAPMGVVSEPEKRDSNVRQMRELELVADVLEQAAESAGNKVAALDNAPKTLDGFIATLPEDEQFAIRNAFSFGIDDGSAPDDGHDLGEPADETESHAEKPRRGRPKAK